MQKSNNTKYNKISYDIRCKLIQMVCENSMPCIQAGRALGISSSTAKMIIKKFKEYGTIFEKKQDKLKRQHLEQFKANTDFQKTQITTIPDIQIEIPFYFYMPYHFAQNLPILGIQ